MLASPLYGERWGRHWLDVARYSDTKGYVFTEERRYPFSYTYRDYVIAAFNEDLPFDRFILEQLAADQLNLGNDRSPLAAMGFLTVGRRFSNNINDIIDDRIDVVSRGLLGLSVTCARCHDHKFDPIPTDDYYSLYGVFASSPEPAELPLLNGLPQTAAYHKFEAELHRLEEAREQFKTTNASNCRINSDSKRPNICRPPGKAGQGRAPTDRKPGDLKGLRPLPIRRWAVYLNKMMASSDPVFVAWQEFSKLPDKDFPRRAAEVVSKFKHMPTTAAAKGRINSVVRDAFVHAPPKSMRDVTARYGKLLVGAERRWRKLLKDSPSGKQPDRPARRGNGKSCGRLSIGKTAPRLWPSKT